MGCSVFCVTDACPCFKRSRLPITSRLGPTDLLETLLDATFVQCTYTDPTCMYVLNLGGAIFRESRLISDKQIEGENYCKINMSWTLTGTIYEIAYYVCRLKNWRILKTESVFFFLKC